LGWNKVSPTHHHILLEKKLFSSSFVQNYSFVRCWDLQKKKIEAKLLSFVSDKTCCRKNFKIFCKKEKRKESCFKKPTFVAIFCGKSQKSLFLHFSIKKTNVIKMFTQKQK
jgi:hypothetical protein